ncbi:MAG: GAF domain-containing protein [Chloroflexaceae bacterium]|nr:GAF domain-containing protein [Chloroflexaceae bacterium]
MNPEHELTNTDSDAAVYWFDPDGVADGVDQDWHTPETSEPEPVDDTFAELELVSSNEMSDKPVMVMLPTCTELDPSNSLAAPLLQVAATLSSVLDYDELLKGATARIVAALPDIAMAAIWLYNERTGKLYLEAYHWENFAPDEDLQTQLDHCYVYIDEGFAGKAFHSGKLLVHTLCGPTTLRQARPELIALIQNVRNHFEHGMISFTVPLSCNNEKLGVLELLHICEDHNAHTTIDPSRLVQVLPTFANLLAATIYNKRLFDEAQRHYRRLDAFDAVVTTISTATDLPDMLRSVLEVILGLLPVSSGAILLLDPAQARLTPGASHNLPAAYVEAVRGIPVSGSACEEVVRYGQPALRPLIAERGETALIEAGFESCAYLPLLAGGTVVGVLALFGAPDLYNQINMSHLMPLSNQIGFAIANVRLYEDSQLERQRLSTVVNSIAEGVVLCDSQGRMVLANEAAIALLSLDHVPYQQPLSEMTDFYGIRDLDGQPLPVEHLPMARALSGEIFHDYRVLIHGVSGDNSVMSFSGAPARADGKAIEGAVVVFRDITANQKLERAKDEFLAVAAHELRSPLAAVRGYAENLLRREMERKEHSSRDVRGLSILSEQVGHMLRMVDNLLDVSRLDAGQLDLQLQKIDLVMLARQVLDQQRLASKHELVLETAYEDLLVECDPLRIRQVLTNLVSNAIKYSPAGSRITVALSTRQLAETLSVTTPLHEEALFAVHDMGGGIAPEQQSRLFERFFRIKSRRTEGLGLGLYLSREFVLMHGGQIWVESTPGQGSMFYFTLPMHDHVE